MKLRTSSNIVKFNWKNFIWITAVHFIAFIFAPLYFTWQGLFLLIITCYLTGMVGITFGFHRLLTHKSLKANRWVEYFSALCGTLACQGGPISWVGQHRVHHAYSDRAEDPHNIKKGFWHSHIGFIFNRRQDLDMIDEVSHYCPDVARNPYYRFLENYMIPIQFLFGFSLLGLGGVLGQGNGFDWNHALSYVVWGVFVRLVVVYNITWLVNSATHLWGSRPNPTLDESRNNWWVAILAFGEGWHNNHHAQPRSARHGWEWWQVDQTWIFINILKYLGLADKITLPSRPQQQEGNIPIPLQQINTPSKL